MSRNGSTRTAAAGSHLPDEIASDLARKILNGELAVGDRLPSERLLCAEYAVSRPVVREALSKLKSDGLVASRAGSGVFVTAQNATSSFRIQNFAVSNREALEQAMELLVAIEVAATRLAALHRTDEDLKRIKRALVGMEFAIANDELGDEEDFQFHQAIVEATHNPHFQALCKHLEFGARNVIRQARTNTRANHVDLLDAVQEEHRAIFRAIAEGDAPGAAGAAERHLVNAAARIEVYLTGTSRGTEGGGA
ncbi:FadR/GntR family transcriptional regulator [Limimaricola pyoseonensis]|uniref:DNA-binding transcriptional regulator, FadR family n=1 Tax=Limimaricola pyoseonensis TaxID=521013 RepID=A0A1G7HGF5_9RHOB|nr:FadR/GntR family transcriptional regulator [Limimaricola pyoseonensis]SDE99597.1 DNA-binding transcriptional regulator, FadR family [Limimaricola pyoseonensis]